MTFKDKLSNFVLKYLVIPRTPKLIPGKKRIACIGDSITFGAGVAGRKSKTWEFYLNGLLGEKYQVINYGISGRTLLDEGDFPYKTEKFYGISRECGAETFLIMLGTNDSKPYNWNRERYERELADLAKEYSELENSPRVILMTPPQCYADPKIGKVAFDISAEIIDEQIVPIVKKTAADSGLQVIDLHELTQHHEDWFSDGVHPNELGNLKIAMYIAQEL